MLEAKLKKRMEELLQKQIEDGQARLRRDPGGGGWTCQVFGERFATRQEVLRHMEIVHGSAGSN